MTTTKDKPAKADKATKADKEKRVAKPKDPFIESLPKGCPLLNENGALLALPIEGVEFVVGGTAHTVTAEWAWDRKKHAPLKKAQFANSPDFLDWSSHDCTQRADMLNRKAVKLQQMAAEERQFGDPDLRKKMKKARKIVESLAELEKVLGGNINVQDLMAAAREEAQQG